HILRRSGGGDAFLHEFIEIGPAVKRAIVRRAEPAAMLRAMVDCGLKTFDDLSRVLLDSAPPG
ncbi:MAG: hypothetical protein V2A74_08720, partial [bacterium]